ncbi:hypothetical protein ACFWAR_32155 [Streptomyces sp. NPDC059917]|uniref:hypothetical protein n=1 Tax=Streptomyces sp. NPDC059917 TaxID=3347002 RepID=UPI00364E417F
MPATPVHTHALTPAFTPALTPAFTPAETHAVLHAARTAELAAGAAAAAARRDAPARARAADTPSVAGVRTLLGTALVAAGTRLLAHGQGYGQGSARPHAA